MLQKERVEKLGENLSHAAHELMHGQTHDRAALQSVNTEKHHPDSVRPVHPQKGRGFINPEGAKVLRDQRVGIFVDVQNLYYSAKYMYNSKVNFAAVLRDGVRNRKPIRAIAYVIKTEQMTEKIFFEALQKIGFEIKAKELQIFFGGAKKGDWDIGLAMDTIEMAPKLDVIVLVSGDGDFVPLVQHLKRAMGCFVEVMSFGKSASAKLKEEADCFIDMDKKTKKYLING